MQNFFEPIKKRKKFNYQMGDVFGRLTLTGITYMKIQHSHWVRYVEAVCMCGEVREYLFKSLSCGDTQSCGCLRKDVSKAKMTTHNLSDHPLYDVYKKMVERCYKLTDKAFKNYGGRNIEVWKDWKDDFVCFYDWSIANGWKQGLELDRIDNDGNYAPYNCRYTTRAQQSRNKRNTRMYTAFGETKCLFDWGKDKRGKVSIWGLRNRMDRGKWEDFEKALTTPETSRKDISRNTKTNVNITAFGETKCMTAWLEDKRCLVKLDSLRDRFKKGWDGKKILTTPPHSSGKKGIIL